MHRNINLKAEELMRLYLQGERDFSRLDLTYIGSRGFPFEGFDLSGSDFTFSKLCEANLVGSNLSNTNWSHTWARNVHLARCTLQGAILHKTYLGSTDLRGADLRGVDLQDISVYLTDFRGAILDPVVLLARWKIKDCFFDESTVVEPTDVDTICSCVEKETKRYRS
jgi:uncharacterized protein YjbI with pentapeptide repeats